MNLTLKDFPKNITLAEFINKCGIVGVGIETSRKIANRVQNIQTLRNLIEEGTCPEALDGIIGSKAINQLVETLSDIDWILLLEDMEDADYDMFSTNSEEVFDVETLEEMSSKPLFSESSIKDLPIDLKGQKICITGTLSLPRKMFQTMIEKNGGIFQGSVTKDTDILIYSECDGMGTVKYKMAEKVRKAGSTISMITEKVFIDKYSKKI